MSGAWRPIALIVATTALVCTLMVLTGMEPEVTLVAALGGIVGIGVWHLGALADATPNATLSKISERSAPPARADRRVARLRTGLAFGRSDGPTLDRLHASLVDIIDDQLRSAHQIDRLDDPVASSALLGDALVAFIDHPDAPASLADPATLDRTLSLIERL